MDTRRSARIFSPDPIPLEAVRNCIDTACTAPSGAQAALDVLLGDQPRVAQRDSQGGRRRRVRNYHGRMSQEWLEDLEQFGTDHIKLFIEDAPALIVVFKQVHDTRTKAGGSAPTTT